MKIVISIFFLVLGIIVGYVVCENELEEKYGRIQTSIYFENALNVLEKEAKFLEDVRFNERATDNLYCSNVKRLSWLKSVDRRGVVESDSEYKANSERLKKMEDFYSDFSRCE